MNTEHLGYVLTLAAEGSFSRAAKRLGITQPALSAYVTKLEEKEGTLLFDRSLKKIVPTEAGDAYIAFAKRLLLEEKDLRQKIADLRGLARGRIVIGGSGVFNSAYIPAAAAKFCALYPEISIKVTDGRVPELAKKTLDGEADFFVTPANAGLPGLHYSEFLTERVFLCAPPSQNLGCDAARVPLEDIRCGNSTWREYPEADAGALAGRRFILLEQDLDIRRISNLFFGKDAEPKTPLIVEQMTTAYALTCAGVGVCFITDSAVRYGNLPLLPVFYAFDAAMSRRKLYVASRSGGYLPYAAGEFIRILREIFFSGPVDRKEDPNYHK